MNNQRISRGSVGQSIVAGKPKRATPKNVQKLSWFFSLALAIYVIPFAVTREYNKNPGMDYIPTGTIIFWDVLALLVVSAVIQGIYHLMGSTTEHKIKIQQSLTLIFTITAAVVYGAFRLWVYLQQ